MFTKAKIKPVNSVLNIGFMKESFTPDDLLAHFIMDCENILKRLPRQTKKDKLEIEKMEKYIKGITELRSGYGGLGIIAMGSLISSAGSYAGAVNTLQVKYEAFKKEFTALPENAALLESEVAAIFIKKNTQAVEEFKSKMPAIATGVWLMHDVYPILMGQFALAPMSSDVDKQFELLYAQYILELQANWKNLNKGKILGMALNQIPIVEPYKDIDAQIQGKLANVAKELFDDIAKYDFEVAEKEQAKALTAAAAKPEDLGLNPEITQVLDDTLQELTENVEALEQNINTRTLAISDIDEKLRTLEEASGVSIEEQLIDDKIVSKQKEEQKLRVGDVNVTAVPATPKQPQGWGSYLYSFVPKVVDDYLVAPVVAPVFNAVYQGVSAVVTYAVGESPLEILKKERLALETEQTAKSEELEGDKKLLEKVTEFYGKLKKVEGEPGKWLIEHVSPVYKELLDLETTENSEIFATLSKAYQLFAKDLVVNKVNKFNDLKTLDEKALDPLEKEDLLFEHLAKIIHAEKELKSFRDELSKNIEMPAEMTERLVSLQKTKDETVKQLAEIAIEKLSIPSAPALNEAKTSRGILGGVYVKSAVVTDVKQVFGKLQQSYEEGESKPKCLSQLSDSIKHAEVEFSLMRLKTPGVAALYREIGKANVIQEKYRNNDIKFLQELFDKINKDDLDDTKRLELLLGAVKLVQEKMGESKISIGVGKLNLMLDNIGHGVEMQLLLRSQKDELRQHHAAVKTDFAVLKEEFKEYLGNNASQFNKYHLAAKIQSVHPHHWYDNLPHFKLHGPSFHMPHLFNKHKDAAKTVNPTGSVITPQDTNKRKL